MKTRIISLLFFLAPPSLLPGETAAGARGLEGDRIETARGSLVVHPIGHATMALGWNGAVLYVDPVGEPRNFKGLPAPDLILITDVHPDHMDARTLNAVRAPGTAVIVPPSAAKSLEGSGVDARSLTPLKNGEKTSAAGIEVEAVPMYNLAADRPYHEKGRGNGYVLGLGAMRVYISGDTEDIPEMRALRGIDVAFICMNLPFTMTAEQAASAVLELRPRIVYPYHFRGPDEAGWQDPAKFERLVEEKAPEIEVRVLDWYPSSASIVLWAVFIAVVSVVIAIDLFIFNREAHQMRVREALVWVAVWVALALLFNAGVFLWMGRQKGAEFLAGYLVELNLSVDNLFVFLVIFTYFSIRPEHQPRVLSWGIFGAIILRMAFIFPGVALVKHFGWLLYVFGLFLLYTGVKLLFHEPEVNPERNWVVRLTRRLLPMTPEFHGQKFFVREAIPHGPDGLRGRSAGRKGRLLATPLFLVLVVIDFTDVVFAVDSVPAILGITRDTFIAFTSNVFAILGLRAMYFVLTAFLDKFHYLKYGLSLVLVFIGAKMLGEHFIAVSSEAALAVVVGILGLSVAFSLLFPPKAKPLPPEEDGKEASGEDDNG